MIALARRLRVLGSDLLLIPSMWRGATRAERRRRFWASPEGVALQARQNQEISERMIRSLAEDDRERSTGRSRQHFGCGQQRPGESP